TCHAIPVSLAVESTGVISNSRPHLAGYRNQADVADREGSASLPRCPRKMRMHRENTSLGAERTSTGSLGVIVPRLRPGLRPGRGGRERQPNAVFGAPASSRTTLIISAGSNGLVR